jgi:hypothetical protein
VDQHQVLVFFLEPELGALALGADATRLDGVMGSEHQAQILRRKRLDVGRSTVGH